MRFGGGVVRIAPWLPGADRSRVVRAAGQESRANRCARRTARRGPFRAGNRVRDASSARGSHLYSTHVRRLPIRRDPVDRRQPAGAGAGRGRHAVLRRAGRCARRDGR